MTYVPREAASFSLGECSLLSLSTCLTEGVTTFTFARGVAVCFFLLILRPSRSDSSMVRRFASCMYVTVLVTGVLVGSRPFLSSLVVIRELCSGEGFAWGYPVAERRQRPLWCYVGCNVRSSFGMNTNSEVGGCLRRPQGDTAIFRVARCVSFAKAAAAAAAAAMKAARLCMCPSRVTRDSLALCTHCETLVSFAMPSRVFWRHIFVAFRSRHRPIGLSAACLVYLALVVCLGVCFFRPFPWTVVLRLWR